MDIDPTTPRPGGAGKTRTTASPLHPQDEHADTLVALARTTPAGELSPAVARAAVRRAHLTDPESLADLAAAARALADQARVVEVAAGSAARAAGMEPQQLADRVGVSLRTVQGRYPHHQVHLDRPGAGLLALVDRDPQGRLRPVVLELHLPTGKVSFAHQGAAPATGTLTGRVWRWPVPLLTGPGAATLLEVVAPLALRILTGTDTVDGARVPDTDARTAAAQVGRVCNQAATTYPVLTEADADTLWADHDPATMAAALGLPTGAGHDQVATAAELARTNALSRLVLLTGAEAYLASAVATTSAASPPTTAPTVRDWASWDPPLPPAKKTVDTVPARPTDEPDPALAPQLAALVAALRPALAADPSPLNHDALHRVCTDLVDAVEEADQARLGRALERLVTLEEAATAGLHRIPSLARAWEALLCVHRTTVTGRVSV
ncbi:hypothetical protein [Nocardiopsis sp. NRRL B-16309]|uniref:hypothetical protein n=1 Tax=Nocardiopsis sp. NRRL B-16309 TaxID=1519494 RepID=UPI0006AFC388|nr:hypothetical protein [Nocardiopsis sp. NRRL B-16309]KOX13681.1 hypothetical protein ADL05_18525 [Nocardiopsis sp. NRRL B-16309]